LRGWFRPRTSAATSIIDDLPIRQYVITAHIVALPEGPWIVEYASKIVDQIVKIDVTPLLPTAAYHNRCWPLGLTHHHIEALFAHAHDLAGPEDGDIEAAVEQGLFGLPTPAYPRTWRFGRSPQECHINQAIHTVRPARRHDILQSIPLDFHEALARRSGMLGRERMDGDVSGLDGFQRTLHRREIGNVPLDDLTAQDCSGCGYRPDGLEGRTKKKLSDRWHLCPICGFSVDLDTNAAINILAVGQHSLASEKA
jgi:hypothetical protein